MFVFLTIIHALVCIFLIIVVLLQSGKAADLAGAFGGMGSQTAFGPRGSATLLSKATTISAVVFMLTSLSLSILATRAAAGPVGTTVLDQQKQSAPATPAKAGQPPAAPSKPVPATVGTTPGVPADKQPSVTIFPEGGGPGKTIPLNIPAPNQAPAGQTTTPAKK